MASQRKQTKEWAPWYNFDDTGRFCCLFCNTVFTYKRDRAFMHFGYKAKTEKAICRKLPPTVRQRFVDCGGIVPARMSHDDMYGGESEIGGPSRPIPSGSSSHIFAENDVPGGGRSETPNTAAREANVVEGRDIPRSMSGDQGASNSTRSVHVRQ